MWVVAFPLTARRFGWVRRRSGGAASIERAMTVFAEQLQAVQASAERLGARSPVLGQELEAVSASGEMRGQ